MGKHIIDKASEPGSEKRVEPYARIERTTSDEPGKVSKTLHRQKKKLDDRERAQRFVGIDRAKD